VGANENANPSVLVVADEVGSGLAEALGERTEAELAVDTVPTGRSEEGDSPRALGNRMVALERIARERSPDTAIIAADPREALAAAIAFAKLELPTAIVGAGSGDAPVIAERLCELLLCFDQAALARLRRAGLGERARLVEAPVSGDAVQALTAWILSRTSAR
jgi:hypothetical protein